jgi:hypothetical protein
MVLLEYNSQVWVRAGHRVTRQKDLTATGGIKPTNDAKQCRLPTARRAHDTDELAVLNGEVYVRQRPNRAIVPIERL